MTDIHQPLRDIFAESMLRGVTKAEWDAVATMSAISALLADLDAAAAERFKLHQLLAMASLSLEALLKRDEMNTCQHEETHRGGVIWEICDRCGTKWADDQGGRPAWKDPAEWDQARSVLSQIKAGREQA